MNYGGYGKLYFGDRVVDAHRVSWMVHVGPIPAGAVIAHRCDVRNCVNPDHLFITTQRGNLADMRSKARESKGAKHAAAIKAGWTPELRAYRAKQTADRFLKEHREAARRAGVPTTWKRCSKCDEWLPPSRFHRHKNRPDGLHVYCKSCRSKSGPIKAP